MQIEQFIFERLVDIKDEQIYLETHKVNPKASNYQAKVDKYNRRLGHLEGEQEALISVYKKLTEK